MKKSLGLLIISLCCFGIMSGCNSADKVHDGDLISVQYTAYFSDGTIFDQNTPEMPLMFTVGSGETIKGLDAGIVGKKVGKTSSIKITPAEWYGPLYSEDNIQKVGKLIFDKLEIVPEIGKIQILDQLEWMIRGIETDENGNDFVLFDLNPRQTWDTLKYEITVLAKQE